MSTFSKIGLQLKKPFTRIGTESQSMIHGDIEDLHKFIQQNEYELKSKEIELRECRQHVECLDKQLRQSKTESEILTVKYNEEFRLRQEMMQRVTSIQALYNHVKTCANKFTESMQETESHCEAAVKENETLAKATQDLEDKFKIINDSFREKEAAFIEKVTALETRFQKKELELKETADGLSASLNEKTVECASSVKIINALEKQLSDLTLEKDFLISTKDTLKGEITALNVAKESLDTRLQTTTDQLFSLQSTHERLVKDHEETLALFSTTKSLSEARLQMINELTTKMSDLEKLFAEKTSLYESQIEELGASKTVLMQQIEDARVLEADLIRKNKTLDSNLTDVSMKLEEIPVLEEKVEKSESACILLRENVNKAEAENEFLRLQLGKKISELNQVGALTFEFAVKIETLETEAVVMQENFDKLTNQLSAAELQCRLIRDEKNALETASLEVKKQLNAALEEKFYAVKELDQHLTILARKEQSEKEFRSEQDLLKNSFAEKELELEKMTSIVEELKSKNTMLEMSIGDGTSLAKRNEEQWTLEKAKLRETLTKVEDDLQGLIKENEALKNLTRQQEETITNFQAEKHELESNRRKSLVQASDKELLLNKDIEDLKKCLNLEMAKKAQFEGQLKSEVDKTAYLQKRAHEESERSALELGQFAEKSQRDALALENARAEVAKLTGEMLSLRLQLTALQSKSVQHEPIKTVTGNLTAIDNEFGKGQKPDKNVVIMDNGSQKAAGARKETKDIFTSPTLNANNKKCRLSHNRSLASSDLTDELTASVEKVSSDESSDESWIPNVKKAKNTPRTPGKTKATPTNRTKKTPVTQNTKTPNNKSSILKNSASTKKPTPSVARKSGGPSRIFLQPIKPNLPERPKMAMDDDPFAFLD